MTDFPDLKIKALVSFPANVVDGTGVDVVKQNGSYQFNLAFDDFAPPTAIVSDPANQCALLWNVHTNQYALTQVAALSPTVSPSTSIPLPNATPGLPGGSLNYSREDHVHPTDMSLYNGVVSLTPPQQAQAATNIAAVQYNQQTLTVAQQAQARQNIGVPYANIVINGDFRINQVGYVSGAVLAAGVYGHDQWKAGVSGGNYSFTQLKSSTQITIAAGKSLIQPVEDVNVVGGSYVLSWIGTAQARAGVNTLTPSGAYAASPLLITGQSAGTVMSVEFNTGTLGTVKLESGANATPFIMRPFDQELLTCQRYWEKSMSYGTTATVGLSGAVGIIARASSATATAGNGVGFRFRVSKRAAPTTVIFNTVDGGANSFSYSSTSGAFVAVGASIGNINENGVQAVYTTVGSGMTAGQAIEIAFHYTADARL